MKKDKERKKKQKVNITEKCKGMKHMRIDILEIPMPLYINIGILQNV